MCRTCCKFTVIRNLASVASGIMLSFGIIGFVFVLITPYSGNLLQFTLIMIYMLFLIVAFTCTLCGTFSESKLFIMAGLVLAVLALTMWLLLTVPTLMAFNRKTISDFCLGLHCGESHWLVPRRWSMKHFADADADANTDSAEARSGPEPERSWLFSGLDSHRKGALDTHSELANFDEFQRRIFPGVKKMKRPVIEPKETLPPQANSTPPQTETMPELHEELAVADLEQDLKLFMQESLRNRTGKSNDENQQRMGNPASQSKPERFIPAPDQALFPPFVDKYSQLNKEWSQDSESIPNNTNSSHSKSKRFIPTGIQFPNSEFIGVEKARTDLTREWSIGFAVMYLLLFLLALAFIVIHLLRQNRSDCAI